MQGSVPQGACLGTMDQEMNGADFKEIMEAKHVGAGVSEPLVVQVKTPSLLLQEPGRTKPTEQARY